MIEKSASARHAAPSMWAGYSDVFCRRLWDACGRPTMNQAMPIGNANDANAHSA